MDLVPWDLFVDEGLLLHVDGALSASFRFRGPDPASSTEEELVGLSRSLGQALRPMGDGWMLHVDLHRVPAPPYPREGAFPDAFTRGLDEERRRRYEGRRAHFVNEQYLTVTHHPGVGDGGAAESALGVLLRADVGREGLEGQIEDFSAALDEISGTLSAVLRLERLGTVEAVRYLYRCLTFRRDRLAVPRRWPFALEDLLGSGDLYGGADLRFGERHIVPIRFTGFPDAAGPATLAFLNDLPLPFRAAWRYLPLDPFTSRRAVKRRRARWNTAGIGLRHALAALFSGSGSGSGTKPEFSERFAPAMAQDADDALLELEREESGVGYSTAVFFTSSADREEAEGTARRLVQYLRNAGFGAAIEDLNALEAYLAALPGQGRANVRRPLLTVPAFCRLAPTTSVWAGEASHPHPVLAGEPPTVIAATSGSTPFALSLGVGDVQHAAVIGPTGSGKSVLLNLLLAQFFRYGQAQVLSLDKGYSQLALVEASGGDHYDLRPEAGGHRFAPLEHLGGAEDLQRAAEWVVALLETAGVEVTPGLRRTVVAGLRDLRESRTRTLSAFALKAQSHEVREALEPYTLDGPYASLFDAERSPLRDGSRFSVVEMEAVLGLRDAAVVPLVLHLFDELERRMSGAPTLLAVEELGGYLERPVFARRLQRYLLELRKRNAGLVLVHQNVAGLLESPLRAAVLDVPTRIYLPNPAAQEPAVAEAYRAMGLNDRQIEVVARAVPKRDYYVVTPRGSRRFQLDLSPGALAVLGLAGPTAREVVAEARESWGSDWLVRYLADRGHEELAALVGSPDAGSGAELGGPVQPPLFPSPSPPG
jgi:type IV secretion system protein TrbE